MSDNLYTLQQVKQDTTGDYILSNTVDGVPMYRRVMQDAEIYQAALEDWLGCLSQLWTAFGKVLDADQMMIYQSNLSGIPLGLLEQSIQRVIREHLYNSVPTVAQVWAAIRKELHNPVDLDKAINEWEPGRTAQVEYVVAVETETIHV